MLTLTASTKNNRRIIATLNAMAQQLADEGGIIKQAEMHIAEEAYPLIYEETPRITGSWQESWLIASEENHTSISVSALTTNPMSIEKPASYAPKVHAWGGRSRSGHERAVFTAFVRDHGDIVLEHGADNVILSLRVFA